MLGSSLAGGLCTTYGENLLPFLDILNLRSSSTVARSLVVTLLQCVSEPLVMVIFKPQSESFVTWKLTSVSLSFRAVLRYWLMLCGLLNEKTSSMPSVCGHIGARLSRRISVRQDSAGGSVARPRQIHRHKLCTVFLPSICCYGVLSRFPNSGLM